MNTNPYSRERILHALYEAAELEHNLMCTYLYAAFSLRDGEEEGLNAREAEAVARWRRCLFSIAVDEMAHLTMVWNITAALGGSPRFGRGNFPLDPGGLPARVVVKLAPFSEAVLQHFIYLERPEYSEEPDGEGFDAEFLFTRASDKIRLTPMGLDYDTVGVFYDKLGAGLQAFAEHFGEDAVFCGDPALQIGPADVALPLPKPVQCSKTAIAAFTAIVQQGEGAPVEIKDSHYQKFLAIRTEFDALKKANPAFNPAWPSAVNPVQRKPVRAGRVHIENEEAATIVDLANAVYALMLRLIAYAYVVPRPSPEKTLVIDLALGLMRAMTPLAERAARLPAGPSSPGCNAGMSFIALRDAAALLPGPAARRFFIERINELAAAAIELAETAADKRVTMASRYLSDLAKRAVRGFEIAAASILPTANASPHVIATTGTTAPERTVAENTETIHGKDLTIIYEAKKCIHARFCVTQAPKTFLANVPGAWIFPDAMDTEALVTVLSQCPSGALQYRRNDGGAEETQPPVNLIAVREAGPYAVRAEMRLDGEAIGHRATLCRCGASKNKPFCDSSHHDIHFSATGEPPTRQADMLSVRDGILAIDLETDGPLQLRGNLEITSGTGRVVARTTQARLCRCGGSGDKPFCDGTHAKIGFKSD